LPALADSRRKVVVLGDMKELGAESEAAHLQVGSRAGHVADLVLAVGQWAPTVARAVSLTAGRECRTYPDVDACIDAMDTWLADGDAILVKGSHSVNLQRLVKRLCGQRPASGTVGTQGEGVAGARR
jgi:UDP-N-acetylmuramoyl-tripeptide--D-alanyl-D-alanine ligase